MTTFPGAERERALVGLFLAAVERIAPPLDEALEIAIDHAHAMDQRLQTPPRIAFAGPGAAGGSALINHLLGQAILPVPPTARALPPTVVSPAPEDRTIAGWWDQRAVTLIGRDLAAAAALSPDFIALELASPALGGMSLVNLPVLDDPELARQGAFALTRLADRVFWCASALSADAAADGGALNLIPARLARSCALVLTGADGLAPADLKAAASRATGAPADRFRLILPLPADLPAGAEALLATVTHTAQEFGAATLTRLRQTIARHLTPALAGFRADHPGVMAALLAELDLPPGFDSVDDVPALAEPTDIAPPAEPVCAIADRIRAGVHPLLAGLKSGEISGQDDFIPAALDLVEAVRTEHEDCPFAGATDESIRELDRAADLLILLSHEANPAAARDCAHILWQLSVMDRANRI